MHVQDKKEQKKRKREKYKKVKKVGLVCVDAESRIDFMGINCSVSVLKFSVNSYLKLSHHKMFDFIFKKSFCEITIRV